MLFFTILFFSTSLTISSFAIGRTAFRKSSKITQGIKWNLLLFSCVVALVNMGGSLAVIGSLWTVPTTMVATAFVYRKLLNQAEGAQPIEMQRSPVH